ncbi:hypothetical protein AMS68_002883 [Peltaster fructicola]|uniref:Tyrosinase copper-binding domain-containing protein n=1 Tax=Peltaster fructicola TaxID=286661 RepID=A0A6H0XRQ1_9PEZI|nr:hypothetical protein AMS68_002883 [Peltaster fructicola]
MVFSQDEITSGSAFHIINDNARRRLSTHKRSTENTTCTFAKASVRREFRNMTLSARKSFTNAVKCLQKIPPKSMSPNESVQYPGVKSRYDEYVATHINYTYNIHMTADFWAWHRYFIWNLEQDLHKCGYNGTLPYWDWQMDAEAPQDSELFNGDQYSMGSNGDYIANRTDTWVWPQEVTFPPGTGGGCVSKGPFSNYTVNLGPLDNPYGGNVVSNYQHNPRCLVRDLNPWFSRQYNTYTNITNLIMNHNNIVDFQAEAQGYFSRADPFGMHGGGHWMAGGNSTLMDFHSSPGDPLFFLHHAQVDRIWILWQQLDVENRQYAISGTSTLNNDPPSAEMTLNDILPFGFVANDRMFGDLMDTFVGPFCYRYQ